DYPDKFSASTLPVRLGGVAFRGDPDCAAAQIDVGLGREERHETVDVIECNAGRAGVDGPARTCAREAAHVSRAAAAAARREALGCRTLLRGAGDVSAL